MKATRICMMCREEKSIDDFQKYQRKEGEFTRRTCRICYRIKREQLNTEFRNDHVLKSVNAQRNKDRYRKMRREVIRKYGGKCECCHGERFEFLAIDHRFGGGGQQRRAGMTVWSMIKMLLDDSDIRVDYRILCHNCNSSHGFYGYCPHERERELK